MARKPRRALNYQGATAAQLAATPSEVTGRSPPSYWPVLREKATARLNMQRSWRQSWIEHWFLLETYLMPRRGIFINAAQPTPNTMIRGMPINQAILDPTGVYAERRCSAGMMSGLMSPSRQWFKLKPALFAREQAPAEAQVWFEEVEDRMRVVMGRCNLYQEAAQVFDDLVTFGTGPMLIYEDELDLVRCYTPCCGEYFLSSSSANRVEAMSRLFVMSVSAIVEEYGLENCPGDVQQMWRSKGGSLEVEKLVAHMIEPNFEVDDNSGNTVCVPGDFTWREMYWCWGSSSERPLRIGGFNDPPHIVPRWAVTSNDPYGRSVGMDVLPDIIQLQIETERKAEALEKQVRPPMVASIEMKNEPASILPGRVTYVSAIGPDKGFRPAFLVEPDIQGLTADLQMVQMRIKEGFFNDLFAMLETVGQKQMTAYEVAQRNQEKLQLLGPVIERLQNEFLAPLIKRFFRIMDRKKLLPPVPNSLHGVPIGIEYVGVLSLAQKAAETAGLERFAQTALTIGQGLKAAGESTDINDNIDWDRWLQEYGDDMSISKRVLRDPKMVAAMRAERQRQQQAMQAMQEAGAMSQIGKNMSSIDVGGGLNAVSAMTGLGPTGGSAL